MCVCHGPARYLFFVLVTLYQLLRESCAWAQDLWAQELASTDEATRHAISIKMDTNNERKQERLGRRRERERQARAQETAEQRKQG